MKTNFEFLGSEPIENVITAMRYKMDRVIFFTYDDKMAALNNDVDNFLINFCGVSDIVFIPLEVDNLSKMKSVMANAIEEELKSGNQVYFDVTGGDELILTAFGMLSENYKTPIHLFDIKRDKVIELDEGASEVLSRDVEQNEVLLDVDKYLQLRGIMPSQVPDNISVTIEGNIPTVSITYEGKKTPSVEIATKLFYVLEDAAKKYGGKYAKKIFNTGYPLKDSSRNRAIEMGILVREI